MNVKIHSGPRAGRPFIQQRQQGVTAFVGHPKIQVRNSMGSDESFCEKKNKLAVGLLSCCSGSPCPPFP